MCVCLCVCVCVCARARACVCLWCSVYSREKSQRHDRDHPPHFSERIYATGPYFYPRKSWKKERFYHVSLFLQKSVNLSCMCLHAISVFDEV